MQTKLNSLQMAWATDWSAFFGNANPLIVEIGFGNADYLIALAKKYPDHNIIGFEISQPSLDKAEKKIKREKLTNAVAIYSRGETALHHLFTPKSITQIHINYPDPWFKSRHAGRRIMQADMVDAIASRLTDDGLFYLATDIIDYAEMSHEILVHEPSLTNMLSAPWVLDFPERLITTKYEERGFQEGRNGHYFKYCRNDHPAPDVPVKEELTVPHVVLRTAMPAQEIAEAVGKQVFHKEDAIHVAVFNGYWNPANNSVLFEVNIEEPTIEQHIGILMRYRDQKEDYVLQFATFGLPRPTEGMHFATRQLAEWVVSLHEDAAITSDFTADV